MIDIRLLKTVPQTKKYIAITLILKILTLVCNAFILIYIANFIDNLFLSKATILDLKALPILFIIKLISVHYTHIASYKSSTIAKATLREKLYTKLLELGNTATSIFQSSELTQIVGEGVDQLEIYYGSYIPQFFYATLSPFILFIILASYNLKVSLVLLACVPLIPLAIILVQKFAKKLLNKYWGSYTSLGVSFLDKLQGLTTLKIYNADEAIAKEMDEASELFRIATMRVLIMQLNSISIMDLVAYGGSMLAIVLTYFEYTRGHITIGTTVLFCLIASEFFIPMRQLGSFFHIAMNGMAAAERMYKILDTSKGTGRSNQTIQNYTLEIKNLAFQYDNRFELSLSKLSIPKGSFLSFVGESGSGKSTLLSLISNQIQIHNQIFLDEKPLHSFSTAQLSKILHYVGDSSYIFKGTFRSNLEMSGEKEDAILYDVLKRVDLYDYISDHDGLDTPIKERGSNLSGGQRQRLIIARAILANAMIYCFDEITSNIDAYSETLIMNVVESLRSQGKTVILVSHRLANVRNSDSIHVMHNGNVVESGNHDTLISKQGLYYELYSTQEALEMHTFIGGDHDA